MKTINGYTQIQLNQYWESFKTDTPLFIAKKLVDDIVQVMSITESNIVTVVARRNGKLSWVELPDAESSKFL